MKAIPDTLANPEDATINILGADGHVRSLSDILGEVTRIASGLSSVHCGSPRVAVAGIVDPVVGNQP